jgi:hypothetical protein
MLHTDPADIGLAPRAGGPRVWGVLTEFPVGGVVVTLVSLADGTTSLYFANGGGMIGGGAHPDVAAASEEVVRRAESLVGQLSRSTETPLPKEGRVRFYVLTHDGTYSADVAQDELVQGSSPLAPLFAAADKVVTQFRLRSSDEQ